jgi:hypothetical protein
MPAAIDPDAFTGNEFAVHQEKHRLGDFCRAAPASKRRGIHHLRVLVGSQVRRRQDRPRSDCIDQHFRSQFQRKASVSATTAALDA